MAEHLEGGDLDGARERLSHLCSRDATGLNDTALARATVESLAENTSDAVVAPLFWGALAGLPGLLGYRAVNTLDAQVGYRDLRYRHFGWAAARLDDLANLLPSRLTGLLTAACARTVGGSSRRSCVALLRDGGQHPSPNSGRPEAAAAGALGVVLGGRNVYPGYAEERPLIGAPGRPVTARDVRRAVTLGRAVGALAAVGAVGTAAVLGRRSS
jgi:adenosylcobinamide-phosphate synthase